MAVRSGTGGTLVIQPHHAKPIHQLAEPAYAHERGHFIPSISIFEVLPSKIPPWETKGYPPIENVRFRRSLTPTTQTPCTPDPIFSNHPQVSTSRSVSPINRSCFSTLWSGVIVSAPIPRATTTPGSILLFTELSEIYRYATAREWATYYPPPETGTRICRSRESGHLAVGPLF